MLKTRIEALLCRLFPLRLPGRVEGWKNRDNVVPTPAWMTRQIYNPAGYRDRTVRREIVQVKSIEHAENILHRFNEFFPDYEKWIQKQIFLSRSSRY